MVDGDVVAILEGLTVVDEDAFANTPARPYFSTAKDDGIEIGAYGDRVVGFSGDDDISFADGVEARDMTVQAGAGSDTVVLGDGDDFVEGNLGADIIIGGGGTDELYGGYGDDILTATTATAELDAADTVFGGSGSDILAGDNGDALIGGKGNDEFLVDLSNPIAEPVTLGDLVPTTEQLVGEVSIAQGAVPTVSYETAAGGIGTNVIVEGRVVIILIGVDPSTLNASNVTINNTNVSS